MKKVKGLSVVMAVLLAAQGGMNPAVFATNSQKEMKKKIQNQFLQTIFFRQDLIGDLKQFLPNNMKEKDIPESFRTPEFLELLKKNKIIASDDSKDVEKEENIGQQAKLRQIIEEDNLELFQKEFEKKGNNPNFAIMDSLFEEHMRVPILHYCVMKKAIKCFKFLLLNGADPSTKLLDGYGRKKYEWDCMSIAICFGEWEMMKILEERGIKKETNPNVWEAAALTHRNNLLKLFISKKEEITNFDECLQAGMKGVARGNNLKGLELLLEEEADVNAGDEYGRTLLHHAAESDATKVVEILIARGADVNTKDRELKTPLHFAAKFESNKTAELLVNCRGIDINAKEKDSLTPLHLAANSKNLELADLLIKKGADINAKYMGGLTPLHMAAYKGSSEIVNLLLKKGANIDLQTNHRETPLHWAVEGNSLQVAELLISKGADINTKNEDGLTPLGIAEQRGFNDLVKLLRPDESGNCEIL